MDMVFIENLQIETIVGIYEHERLTPQWVRIDLEMSADIARAAATENIEDALNYHALSIRLESFITESRFYLIETMAEAIASLVREEFQVGWVRVTLAKPAALEGSTNVGVRIERGDAGA